MKMHRYTITPWVAGLLILDLQGMVAFRLCLAVSAFLSFVCLTSLTFV
eukprot:SAG11_NODE_42619_length_177_cov_157.320513_1_plen_47_part_01